MNVNEYYDEYSKKSDEFYKNYDYDEFFVADFPSEITVIPFDIMDFVSSHRRLLLRSSLEIFSCQ